MLRSAGISYFENKRSWIFEVPLLHYLTYFILFERNLPESLRQYVDHHEVIPSLWPELLESTGRGSKTIWAINPKLVWRPCRKEDQRMLLVWYFNIWIFFQKENLLRNWLMRVTIQLIGSIISISLIHYHHCCNKLNLQVKKYIIRKGNKKLFRNDAKSNNLFHCYLFCNNYHSISWWKDRFKLIYIKTL